MESASEPLEPCTQGLAASSPGIPGSQRLRCLPCLLMRLPFVPISPRGHWRRERRPDSGRLYDVAEPHHIRRAEEGLRQCVTA
jgi:hypothetical protein